MRQSILGGVGEKLTSVIAGDAAVVCPDPEIALSVLEETVEAIAL
jgi:hypothetical protein